MRKTAVYQGPDPAFRGVAGYATPTQCDSDVWMFECTGGRCVALQSELRFTSPGDLADPAATDWSVLEKAFDASLWGLVITVALLIAIAWGVTVYGWYVTVKAITGAVAVLIIWWSARRM